MTLKEHRYQVDGFGFPKDEAWAIVGWSGDLAGAVKMSEAAALHPSCTQTRIIDREAPLEGAYFVKVRR